MLRTRLTFFAFLAFSACGDTEAVKPQPDSEDRDAAISDSGTPGPTDAGRPDSGTPDSGAPDSGAADGGETCQTARLTWGNFGDAFFEKNCRSCHAQDRSGNTRLGAPVGVDFDTEEQVSRLRDRIRKAVIEEKRMPPTGQLSDCSYTQLGNYLDALACTPDCAGKQCGDNGCGSCGDCTEGKHCEERQCVTDPCVPACAADSCGDDGCGGSCSCSSEQMCTSEKTCACVPDCTGKRCGSDGCGGECGACNAGSTCNSDGTQCSCVPSCGDKQCGDDGCGGSCGTCDAALTCNTASGTCQTSCTPDCSGRSCGSDGCGGSCGTCEAGESCTIAGACACVPSCEGHQCGDNGCGGSCGPCTNGTCNTAGQCIAACSPSCTGRSCGDNGCGGSCGSCPGGQTCTTAGTCQAPSVDFAANVYPIFAAAGCGSSNCHGGGDPARGLDLSSAAAALADLVSVPANECGERLRVAPGAPESSYLINKLTGVDMCEGERMPRGGAALSAPQLDTIRAWIVGL